MTDTSQNSGEGKNIAIFIRSLNRGGAEKQCLLLAKGLSKLNNVVVIVFYKEGDLLKSLDGDESLFFFPSGNVVLKCVELYRYLVRNRVQVLFNFLPLNNILGGVLGRLARVNNIYNGIRGTNYQKGKLKMSAQFIVSNYLVDGVISNSFMAKSIYIQNGYKQENIAVVHNGISVNRRLICREESERVNILTVGRFVCEKDYKTAIYAVRECCNILAEIRIDIKYWIVGYGEYREEIISLINELDLSNVITVHDGRMDLSEFYMHADVYLSTSKHEGMSNTIMEAMSYSLPIIATDSGDTSFLVKDEYNGFICNIGDRDVLGNRLSRVAQNAKMRLEMGANSYNKIVTDFSMEKMVAKYVRIVG